MKNVTILVLGGYGGTGKVFCRYLLKETGVNIIVAGRRLEKAEEVADQLKKEFPPERISARYADASDVASLRRAFQGIDFVLVAATTTQWAKQIAEAALEANVDYLDIYFEQRVYPVLESMAQQIEQSGRCFITQAGFHPGLPAVYIRHGVSYFDRYDKAVIAFAMNAQIEDPESVYEIMDSVANYKAEVFKAGKWRAGSFMNAVNVDFGSRFGVRSCIPIDMIEIKAMPEMFKLQETAVVTPGFNWFIDYILFPLMLLSQKIRKGAFRREWAKLFIWGWSRFSGKADGVVFLLQAEGKKDGKPKKVEIFSEHESAYDFTIIPVIGCLKQYLDGSIRKPGLWMMGQIVDTGRLLDDMKAMNVKLQIRET